MSYKTLKLRNHDNRCFVFEIINKPLHTGIHTHLVMPKFRSGAHYTYYSDQLKNDFVQFVL